MDVATCIHKINRLLNEERGEQEENDLNAYYSILREDLLSFSSDLLPDDFAEKIRDFAQKIETMDFEEWLSDYVSLFKMNLTFLTRHPDPYNPKDGPSNYYDSSQKTRALTKEGVREAKVFAEELLSLIHVSPISTKLFVYASSNKRATLFQDIIKHVVRKNSSARISNERSKWLTFDTYAQDVSAISAGISVRELMEKTLFPKYMISWITTTRKGKSFRKRLRKYVDSIRSSKARQHFVINVLITHLPTMAAYLDIEEKDSWRFKPTESFLV